MTGSDYKHNQRYDVIDWATPEQRAKAVQIVAEHAQDVQDLQVLLDALELTVADLQTR